jgi:hypothetical protein
MRHPSLSSAPIKALALRKPAEIGRNDPCWCRSGKKYKICHLNRASLPELNPHQVADAVRKEFRRSCCSYADDVGNPCAGSIINSHTVQKEGGLRAIARSGKVYSLIPVYGRLAANDGKLEPNLVGISDASVFAGFCAKHDNDLFRPIEGSDCTIGPREALLFAYRAACYEAFMKRAQLSIAPLYARLDEGKPVDEQEYVQTIAHAFATNSVKGEQATRSRKAAYDQRIRTNDVSDFHYSWVRFDGLLPIACCGAFLPDNDLAGNRLQRIGHGYDDYDQVTISITSYNGRSVLVLGWTSATDGPAAKFAKSFMALHDADKASCAVRLPLEYLENSFLEPDWWESLDAIEKEDIVRRSLGNYGNRPAAVTRALSRPAPRLTAISVVERGGSS